MRSPLLIRFDSWTPIAVAALVGLAASIAPAQARITKIVILATVDPDSTLAPFGTAGPLKRIRGTAFGELDVADPRNDIIQDLRLAPQKAAGKVEYQASVQLPHPSDGTQMYRLMLHDR